MRMLIIGCTGGTGTFGVQYAKSLGYHVIGVCSKKNTDFALSLGVDEVNAYDVDAPWYEAMEAESLDLVYDCVGGKVFDRGI